MTVLAAVAAALAAWLVMAPTAGARARVDSSPSRGTWAPARPRSLVPVAVVAVSAGALLMLLDGLVLALGLILLGAVALGSRMVARMRLRRAAEERADHVVEVCEALAGELRAGQPPLLALRHCVEVWADLEPVASAATLGADVPTALRRLARLPGASGLAEVAAAWKVSEGAGGTMAVALTRVAEAARARRATQRLVMSELSSAQATARLVAALPVVVLLMGSGLGGDPWGFLLATPPGLGCLAVGLLLAYAGLAWIEKIAVAAVDP
jgi:tight adherence protein B